MTGIMSTIFSHLCNNSLSLKLSPIQVAKIKVSHHFFYKGWHWDGSIRRLKNGWVVAG